MSIPTILQQTTKITPSPFSFLSSFLYGIHHIPTKIFCASGSMNALWEETKYYTRHSVAPLSSFLSVRAGLRLRSESKQTYHFLHVGRHGLDSTAQPVVLWNNPKTLPRPKAWKEKQGTTITPLHHYIRSPWQPSASSRSRAGGGVKRFVRRMTVWWKQSSGAAKFLIGNATLHSLLCSMHYNTNNKCKKNNKKNRFILSLINHCCYGDDSFTGTCV